MAIAVVQTSPAGGGLETTSGTIFGATLPAAPTTGNLLIAFGASDGLAPAAYTLFKIIGRTVGTAADLINSYKYAASDAASQPTIFSNSEANIYCVSGIIELSGAQSVNGFSAQSSSTSVTPASQTYTAPSITTPSFAAGVGILFSVFAIEDYNGITSATPPSGWQLVTFAQNGGNTSNIPVKLYVMYLLAPTANAVYNPALTYVGTPNVLSATVQSFTINNYTSPGPRRRSTAEWILAS